MINEKPKRISGTTFLGNNPELDCEFNEMVVGLRQEIHTNNPQSSTLVGGEDIEGQGEPRKPEPDDRDKYPTQRQDEEDH